MFRLNVNGQDVDLLDARSIVLNKELFNIENPNLKTLAFSNRFVIPKTSNNVNIFKSITPDKYAQSFNALMYWETDFVIKGKARIIKDQRDTLTIQVTDNLRDFWQSLDRPMSDLDLSNFDFTFGRTGFTTHRVDSLLNLWIWTAIYFKDPETAGFRDDYTYPAIGSLNTSHTDLGVSRPCYKSHKLVELIIEATGFKFNIDAVESILNDCIMPSNSQKFWISDYQRLYINLNLAANTELNLFTDGLPDFATLTFYQVLVGAPTTLELLGVQSRVALSGTLVGNVSTQLTISILESGNTNPIEQVYDILGEEMNVISPLIPVLAKVTFKFSTAVVFQRVRVTGLVDEKDIYTYTGTISGGIVDGWYASTGGTTVPMLENYRVLPKYNVPDWTQKKFLEELSKLFNLQFDIEGDTVVVKFKKDINKVSKTSFEKITNATETNKTKLNNVLDFKYKNGVGTAFHRIVYNNVNLQNEIQTIVELPTVATEENEIPTTNQKMAFVPTYKIVNVGRNTDPEDRLSVDDRFLFIDDRDIPGGVLAEQVTQGYFDNTSPTNIPNSKSLIMSELYDLYYSFIYDNLDKAIQLQFNRRITYLEFKALLSEKVIYSNEHGLYFYVLDVKKFNPFGETTFNVIEL